MRTQAGLLRRAAAALGQAATLDDIARSALSSALELPGVVRAGIALNRVGGRQLQFVSTDEDRLGPSLQWCLIDTFDPLPLNDAVRSGDDILLATFGEITGAYPDLAKQHGRIGTRGMAALALSTGGDRLGGLLLTYDREQRFDEATRWLLTSFAVQVSQALRRERATQADLTTAEALQRSLMLSALPEPEGLVVSARYQPGGLNSDVGGDWYDVFDMADGSTVLVVGDVMGKGADAAILMGEIRTALRAYTLLDPTPSAVLGQLDRFVSRRTEPDQLVTVVIALISPDRGHATVGVAGHPPPLLVRGGDLRYLANGLGPALGLGAGPWPDIHVSLQRGDALLAFSDGLVQGRDVDIYTGMTQLREQLSALPARRLKPRDLCAEARRAMVDVAGSDDVTILAVATASPDAHRATLELPHDPRAAGIARRFVRRQIDTWGADLDTVETAELCVSELVTNAVLHGGTSTSVAAELNDGLLTVVVEDRGGRGSIEPSPEDPTLVSGRGLVLVDALTASWGAEQVADTTTVWFELELQGAPTSEPAS